MRSFVATSHLVGLISGEQVLFSYIQNRILHVTEEKKKPYETLIMSLIDGTPAWCCWQNRRFAYNTSSEALSARLAISQLLRVQRTWVVLVD